MEPQDHGGGVGMEAGHRGGKGLGAQGEQGLREPGATWIPLEEDAGPAKGPPARAVPLFQAAARVGAAGVGAGLGGSGRRQPGGVTWYPRHAPSPVRPAVLGGGAELQQPPLPLPSTLSPPASFLSQNLSLFGGSGNEGWRGWARRSALG